MKTDKRGIERRMIGFEQACRGAGVKLAHQRAETVYQALGLFGDLGLITTLGPPRERTRFGANLRRHHHFVCRRCGLNRDFYSDAFDELRLPQSVGTIGSVETAHVEARGV